MKAYVAAFFVAALAACGGGGGSASGPPDRVNPSPSPSPFPSNSPFTAAATGRVVDYTTGVPIAGATVVIGSTLIVGATPPPVTPSGDAVTTTASDGTFSLPAVAGNANMMVFTSDHITLHAPVSLTNGANNVGDLRLSFASSEDVSWLSAINADRANYGARPVVLDERLTEAARLWDSYEALNGRYGDTDPLAPSSYFTSIVLYGSLGGFNVPISQNGAGGFPGDTGITAEAAFRAEGESGQHFSTIIAASQRWVGLAKATCSGPQGSPCASPGLSFTLDIMTPPGGI